MSALMAPAPGQHLAHQEAVVVGEVAGEGFLQQRQLARTLPRAIRASTYRSRWPPTSAASMSRPENGEDVADRDAHLDLGVPVSFSTRCFSAVRAATRSQR